MIFDWRFLFDGQTIAAIASGLRLTTVLTVCSALGATAVGITIAGLQLLGPAPLKLLARTYTNIVRNVPLLIQLFFVYFGITIILPPGMYPVMRSSNLGAVVTVGTISLVMAGFIAEVIRAGVDAIPLGQMEAALATGLSTRTIWRHVITPQLLPIILPGLSNEMINVLKATTFAMTIGVMELMWEAQNIEAQTFRGVETMCAVTFVYFLLSTAIIVLFRYLEGRLRTTLRARPG